MRGVCVCVWGGGGDERQDFSYDIRTEVALPPGLETVIAGKSLHDATI